MPAPRKLVYQTLSRPISIGTLRSVAVVRKCSSIACIPASSSAKRSGPIATTREVPIAESSE